MAKIYVVANRKGGCAKTTTVGALSSGVGRKGYKVLAIDFDPQGNLTQWNRINAENIDTIYEVLHGEVKMSDVVQKGKYYDIVPSWDLLTTAESDFSTRVGREKILSDALVDVEDAYDFIFIDTPPALNLLNMMAFTAAKDGVLITSDASAFATQGMDKLVQTLDAVRKYYNPGCVVKGIIIGRVNLKTNAFKIMRDFTSSFAEVVDAPVYKTCIRSGICVVNSQLASTDLLDEGTINKPIEDYYKLVDEFLERELD